MGVIHEIYLGRNYDGNGYSKKIYYPHFSPRIEHHITKHLDWIVSTLEQNKITYNVINQMVEDGISLIYSDNGSEQEGALIRLCGRDEITSLLPGIKEDYYFFDREDRLSNLNAWKEWDRKNKKYGFDEIAPYIYQIFLGLRKTKEEDEIGLTHEILHLHLDRIGGGIINGIRGGFLTQIIPFYHKGAQYSDVESFIEAEAKRIFWEERKLLEYFIEALSTHPKCLFKNLRG